MLFGRAMGPSYGTTLVPLGLAPVRWRGLFAKTAAGALRLILVCVQNRILDPNVTGIRRTSFRRVLRTLYDGSSVRKNGHFEIRIGKIDSNQERI